MRVSDFLNFGPLLNYIGSKFFLAFFAQINDLGPVRIAIRTKIIKEYVNLKILWNYLTLILSNVLRTQLHLTSADVISILYEGCIEHDTAERICFETIVLEFYLDVTSQSE